MIYSAEILEIDFSDDYEGRLWLRCNSQKLLVAHQIPLDGSSKYLIPGQTLYIDLWLFYANPMHSLLPQKQIPKTIHACNTHEIIVLWKTSICVAIAMLMPAPKKSTRNCFIKCFAEMNTMFFEKHHQNKKEEIFTRSNEKQPIGDS